MDVSIPLLHSPSPPLGTLSYVPTDAREVAAYGTALVRDGIASLRPLAGLASLAVTQSPKLKSLSGVESLGRLRELILSDNCGYRSVDEIADLTDLESLCLEGGFSKALTLETLQPLSGLGGLRTLRLAALRVRDKSLHPLGSLQNLRDVFIAATFPAGELAWLAEALPKARGAFLDSHR